jgi:3-oxoacyl-[acyl-carrier protein] reductase
MTRTVVITGGTRGIGLAIARRMADAGHRVAVTARNAPGDDLPDGVTFHAADMTDAAGLDAALAEIREQHGPVEILVANAGLTRDQLVLRMSDDDFAAVVDANLTGSYRIAKRVVRDMMKARWGRMIFVSSVVGFSGQTGQANYAASKAGLLGLARTLAREFASRNITSNMVVPGPIDTAMLADVDDAVREGIAAAVPLGRYGTADEVAAAVQFLCSDDAAFITGAVLPVDGGLAMGL